MITLWAFGTTQGLEHLSFNPRFTAPVDIDWTVLREVQFDANIPTIFIQRIKVGSNDLTWVGIYKSVFEVGYQRLGGYYGAGAWLQDHTVDPHLLLEVLTEMQDRILENAIQNGQFKCKLKDVVGFIGPSDEISRRLMKTLSPQNAGIGLNSQSNQNAILSSGQYNEAIVEWAFNEASSQNYRGICIIPSKTNLIVAANSRFKIFKDFLELHYSLIDSLVASIHRLNQENLKLKEGIKVDEEVISKLQYEKNELRKQADNLNHIASNYQIIATEYKEMRNSLNDARDKLQIYEALNPANQLSSSEVYVEALGTSKQWLLRGIAAPFVVGALLALIFTAMNLKFNILPFKFDLFDFVTWNLIAAVMWLVLTLIDMLLDRPIKLIPSFGSLGFMCVLGFTAASWGGAFFYERNSPRLGIQGETIRERPTVNAVSNAENGVGANPTENGTAGNNGDPTGSVD